VQNNFISRKKLGILGGGQLGRMLIREAMRYPLDIYVLDPDKDAPCKNYAQYFEVGSFADYETVLNFGRKTEVLTIEIEHVNVEALKQLEKEGIEVFPQAAVIEMIQDKGLQKQFYAKHNIPTADFRLINKASELNQLEDNWFPAFLKSRTLGYDGKGVVAIHSKKDFHKAFDAPSVLEIAVKIKTELSVIVAVGKHGEIKSYPAVDMAFNEKANLVEYLFVPSRIEPKKLEEAKNIAEKVALLSGIRGLLAVELFIDNDDRILVNEIAPRTHNSGHHTFEANVTSQFEQHMRAVCGFPLGETTARSAAVMVNLLGEEGYSGEAVYQGLEDIMQMEGVYLHLYGKKITKPFRKMGHATIIDKDLNTAIHKAEKVKSVFKIISK
jgi:5-(carboxyamino)imidazole ribonucleotide synthase